jgi:hypothetical protein
MTTILTKMVEEKSRALVMSADTLINMATLLRTVNYIQLLSMKLNGRTKRKDSHDIEKKDQSSLLP